MSPDGFVAVELLGVPTLACPRAHTSERLLVPAAAISGALRRHGVRLGLEPVG